MSAKAPPPFSVHQYASTDKQDELILKSHSQSTQCKLFWYELLIHTSTFSETIPIHMYSGYASSAQRHL